MIILVENTTRLDKMFNLLKKKIKNTRLSQK